MSWSWLVSRPLRGEKEPSKAAEPMVKASQPAAFRAWIRAGLSTLPAQISVPALPKPLPGRLDQIDGIGLGRPIGQEVDPRTAHLQEAPAIIGDRLRRAAELGRMADGLAGKRVIGDGRALDGCHDLPRIGAAQQPVDTDLGRDLRRMHRRLGAGGDHLHVARGARRP